MKVGDIREGVTYEGKSGARRKVLELGEIGKQSATGSVWAWCGVRYLCLDSSGPHKRGEVHYCERPGFAKWAVREAVIL